MAVEPFAVAYGACRIDLATARPIRLEVFSDSEPAELLGAAEPEGQVILWCIGPLNVPQVVSTSAATGKSVDPRSQRGMPSGSSLSPYKNASCEGELMTVSNGERLPRQDGSGNGTLGLVASRRTG